MIQRREQPAPRARSGASRSGSCANGVGQHLDRDIAIELCVAGAINLAHPAGAERPDYFVWPETRTTFQCHEEWPDYIGRTTGAMRE